MIEPFLRICKKIIPKPLFTFFQPAYHFLLALTSVLIYRFPSRNITVVAVTGTKGKSSVTELVSGILEAQGKKTALLNTIRFKFGDTSTRNTYKMSVPGRFFVQWFIRKAVSCNCDYVVLEMTSEGAKQFRHFFIDYDALIFTNLTPEHIQSHGSFEKYRDAKLSIARRLIASRKKNPKLIVNADSPHAHHFLALPIKDKWTYSKNEVHDVSVSDGGIQFSKNETVYHSSLQGTFNLENILASIAWAESENIPSEIIKAGIKNTSEIKGRLEKINAGQSFEVYVDYAHTKESLEAVYKTFKEKRKICVLGATGGGRDSAKREEMGVIADTYCEHIILTDEDPYDESPQVIMKDVASGVRKHTPELILDRKKAIERACSLAGKNDVVFITGKGTDPYIMRANGTKEPWSDAEVAHTVLKNILTVKRN
ncbi:MAG: UDP-N-acetylmuramyl-tripeptide synthetase [Candidatus Paceibacterota bacterium]